MKINIDLNNIENTLSPAFRWLLKDTHRYKVLVGGAGSSKSWSVAITILYKILRDFDSKKHRVLCLRKTSPAARKSVFALFTDLREKWNLEKLCDVNKTDQTITFLNGSKILIGGLDDESKLKSIESLTAIWLEECTEHSKETFLQCKIRLRGESEVPHEMYLSLNPISKNCFVYKDFVVDKTPNSVVHNSTFLDNTFIDDGYKAELSDLVRTNKQYHKIYMLGEWCDPEATIFTNFEVIKEIPPHYTMSDRIYGIDFGYTHPTTVVSVIKDGNSLFVEEMYYKTQSTNQDLINWIKKELPHEAIIYADSAEPQRILEHRRENIGTLSAIKGNDSIRNSIDYLCRFNMFVPETSKNLIAELQDYCWMKDKEGNVQEKPVNFHDDAIAALRYAAFSHFAQARVYECLY